MRDITQRFLAGASSLSVGQMIQSSAGLPLLEAMSALQMMDPKTDTGMTAPGPSHFDPGRSLSAEEVCWVMDEMLALEIAWYRGATLCQSVYTCLYYLNADYMDSPDTNNTKPASHILRSFVLGYGKCIDLAFTELSKGHVNDGEDCWLDHYGVAIAMSDDIDDLLIFMEQAILWLETYDDPWSSSIAQRLDVRLGFLSFLRDPQSPVELLNYLARLAGNVRLTNARVSHCFVTVDSNLRQNMPLPLCSTPTHAESWKELVVLLRDMSSLNAIARETKLWQAHSRLSAWSKMPLGLTRSLIKSVHSSGLHEGSSADFLGLYAELPTTIMRDLQSLIPNTKSSQLAVWLDLIRGYSISTITVPLLNRSRQRRAYESLSFAWRERAAIAEHLGSDPRFLSVAQAMHAVRLHCLLEGSLAALDLDLTTTESELETWWWIRTIATALVGPAPARTWLDIWAHLWLQISSALLALHAIIPVLGPVPTPSRSRFELRYKWALKRPILPNGVKVDTGLSPSFAACMQVKGERNEDSPRNREIARMYLDKALTCLSSLLNAKEFEDTAGIAMFIGTIRYDIENIQSILLQDRPLRWGTRTRWIRTIY